MKQVYETWFRKKHRSVKTLYRWLKVYYLPAIDRKIEQLPEKVAALANKVERKRSTFVVL